MRDLVRRSCGTCASEFFVTSAEARRGGVYCSRPCAQASRTTTAATFWAKVAVAGAEECWPWRGPVDEGGVGKVGWSGLSLGVHRLAWSLSNGGRPPSAHVLHRCGQPACCNPAHLFLGTQTELARGRDWRISAARRLEHYSYPEPTTGCLLWIGFVSSTGYGKLSIRRDGRVAPRLAHRVAYELTKGPIPEGLCVCHKCDTPPCINPDHLFLGSHQDNNQDMARKGRARAACLTEDDVRGIIAALARGERHAQIAARYGVSATSIDRIATRRTWRRLREAS